MLLNPSVQPKREWGDVPPMTEAICFNVVSLRVPAHPDVFISIRSNDVFLIGREKDCVQRGRVSQYKLAVRWILV